MCGILGFFNVKGNKKQLRRKCVAQAKLIRHRGPDASGIKHYAVEDRHHFILHERLSIVDPSLGAQPVFNDDETVCAVVNCEIYNHLELRSKLKTEKNFVGHNDAQIVPRLYKELGIEETCNLLSGKFGIIIYDVIQNRVFVVRDHMGILPVYLGFGKYGELFVSSELKAIAEDSENLEILLPGHYYDSEAGKQIQWYKPLYREPDYLPEGEADKSIIRKLLEQSVERRLMSDVPYAVLLSGGLDSSLTAAITARLFKEHQEKDAKNDDKYFVAKKLHSFCVGLKGSPDLAASRKVANYIGTEHHEFIFTVEEGIDAIYDVIYSLETFNVTTIRAATPMYLLSRLIKSLGIKVVITGEGADELFGGYLYFHKAPNKEEFYRETVRKLLDLYKFDLLRANKATMAWGIEARVPFLDKDFVEYNMSYSAESKMITKEHKNIEKYVLRSAFDDPDDPILPEEILWRQKEQFSDGVGYNWVDGLKDYCEEHVSDKEFELRATRFPVSTPQTKEAYYYREIFEKHYPKMTAVLTVPFNKSIACSTEAALKWDESFLKNADESGRSVLGVHESTNK